MRLLECRMCWMSVVSVHGWSGDGSLGRMIREALHPRWRHIPGYVRWWGWRVNGRVPVGLIRRIGLLSSWDMVCVERRDSSSQYSLCYNCAVRT